MVGESGDESNSDFLRAWLHFVFQAMQIPGSHIQHVTLDGAEKYHIQE